MRRIPPLAGGSGRLSPAVIRSASFAHVRYVVDRCINQTGVYIVGYAVPKRSTRTPLVISYTSSLVTYSSTQYEHLCFVPWYGGSAVHLYS